MNSLILNLENALVERAKSAVGPLGFKVESFPARPADYVLSHPVGVALVVYKGSQYGKPQSTEGVVQERTLTFEVTLLVRNLRTHQGGYAALDALRGALSGWEPDGAATNSWILKDGFVHQGDGIWQFSLDVAIPALSLPAEFSDDPLGANLVHLTYVDPVDATVEVYS